jgi:hypothetical protein
MSDPMAVEVPAGFLNAALGIRLAQDPETMYLTFGTKLRDSVSGPIAPGTVVDLGTALANALKPRLDSDWTFVEMKMQQGPAGPNTPPAGVGPIFNGPLNIVGTGALTGTLPVNSAHLISKRTGQGGRRNQGRFYFPGVAEGGVNDLGILDGAQVSALNTVFASFLNVLDGHATFEGMWILHNFAPGAGGPLLPPTRVTALITQPLIATQRRRLRR